MEEDTLDLAVGDGEQQGRERTSIPGEDQRRLPVELTLLDLERGATRRRHHECRDVLRALERPPEVAHALKTRPSRPRRFAEADSGGRALICAATGDSVK